MSRDSFALLARQWLKTDTFHHVVTLNPEMVVQAEDNDDFRRAVGAAAVRVPDGTGLVWAQWFLRSDFWALMPSLLAFAFRSVERIPGVELVHDLARVCAKERGALTLLGGTGFQVRKTAERLRREVPGLEVAVAETVADVKEQAPSVLLVAYGAPKQTLWIERHRAELPSVRIAVGVGGAFAMISEERPRAPKWIRRLNAEWLWRLMLEPSRLPRIWRAVVEFPRLIARQKRDTLA